MEKKHKADSHFASVFEMRVGAEVQLMKANFAVIVRGGTGHVGGTTSRAQRCF